MDNVSLRNSFFFHLISTLIHVLLLFKEMKLIFKHILYIRAADTATLLCWRHLLTDLASYLSK